MTGAERDRLRLVRLNLFSAEVNAGIVPAQARSNDAAHASPGERVKHLATFGAEPSVGQFAQHRVKNACAGLGLSGKILAAHII